MLTNTTIKKKYRKLNNYEVDHAQMTFLLLTKVLFSFDTEYPPLKVTNAVGQ